MSPLEGWDLNKYRAALRKRAEVLQIDGRVQVRFDESDLVQETLMRAADPGRAPCEGETDGQRLAWLYVIQERVLWDKYDEQFAGKRDARREVDVAAMRAALLESTADYTPNWPDNEPTPSDQVVQREELAILDGYLDELPLAYREVLLLRREGLTMAEIAERLGVTVGVAAGRITQATKHLMARTKKLRKETGDG
jgi:RNA polymerase sigma factor (sigma-70 family)